MAQKVRLDFKQFIQIFLFSCFQSKCDSWSIKVVLGFVMERFYTLFSVNHYGVSKHVMLLLRIVISQLVSIELELKHFPMILQVVMENQRIKISDIFMVIFEINHRVNYFVFSRK
jgi:hypothetical protein